MDSAFEKAAFDLATGEMSKVVEAEGRYYIIRCTSDNDKAKTEVNKSAILEKRKLEKFNEDFENMNLIFTWNLMIVNGKD